jgi:hypothetical protein
MPKILILASSFLSLNFLGYAAMFNIDGRRVASDSNLPGAEVIVNGQSRDKTPFSRKELRQNPKNFTLLCLNNKSDNSDSVAITLYTQACRPHD